MAETLDIVKLDLTFTIIAILSFYVYMYICKIFNESHQLDFVHQNEISDTKKHDKSSEEVLKVHLS